MDPFSSLTTRYKPHLEVGIVKKYISLAMICLILLPTAAMSQDGWKFPTWNPFKTKAAPVSRPVNQPTSSSPFQLPKFGMPEMKMPQIKMPQMKMPSFSAPTFARPKPPQAWQNFSESSKRFFTKSKHTLLPWTAPQNNQPFTGSRGFRNPPKPESNGFFSSWWGQEPEPKQPRTVNEWLQQPRPSFR